MVWNNYQLKILREEYPNPKISLYDICKKIGKTKKAIFHKASRECIHRSKANIDRKYQSKEDVKIIQRRYWIKNKNKIRIRRKLRRNELKKKIVLLLEGECKMCHIKSQYYQIYDFHHNNKDKEENVGTFISRLQEKKAVEEAKKCVLLCSNCHKIEQYKTSSIPAIPI